MLGLLPDLTPRDSHSVWYTSSRNPFQGHFQDGAATPTDRPPNPGEPAPRRHGHVAVERSQLARLRADEQYKDRRLLNIQNFGAGWLRPPGVPKTLHQLREEQREAAEHAEAMRREQVQAELAEAEAEAAAGDEPFDGESALDDMGDGARDLDEEIPDADATGMGMSGIEASEMSSDPVSSDADDDDEDANEENDRSAEGRESELIQARMRMGNDSFRQALARGDADAGDLYGAEEELEAEDDGQLLLEEDSSAAARFGAARDQLLDEDGGDMDMEADLDGSIPEAGQMSGVYEHTDSEAELSSSLPSSSSGSDRGGGGGSGGGSAWRQRHGDEDPTAGFLPRSSVAALGMPTSPTLRARGADKTGGRGHRHGSVDLSSLLSGGESSVVDSSPQRR